MRNIEGIADFIETKRFPVFRERVLHLQPRCVEQVAQGVFVFEAVEATLGRTALGGDAGLLGAHDGFRKSLGERRQLGGLGARLFFRRHFAIGHAIEDPHPRVEIFRVAGREGEVCQIQAALFLHVVMTTGAVFLDERCGAGWDLGAD